VSIMAREEMLLRFIVAPDRLMIERSTPTHCAILHRP
jgi:hypothetical protein